MTFGEYVGTAFGSYMLGEDSDGGTVWVLRIQRCAV